MDIDTTPKSGASAMVPVGIGIVAIVAAIAALVMAMSNGSAADASNKKIAALESTISDMSAKVDKAASQAASAQSQVGTLSQGEQSDITKVYSQVGTALTDRDKAITELQQKVAELSSGGRSTTAAGSGGGKASAGPSGPGGSYTIQSGDNFSSVAKKNGVTLSALEAANPGVDSTKLKVGQKINLPGKAESAPKSSTPATGSSAPAAQ